MSEVSVSQASVSNSAEHRRTEFEAALKLLAARIGTAEVNVTGTPISTFKVQYATILNRVRAGSIEVVTRRGEPFVLLNLSQVLALVQGGRPALSVREVLAGLPSVSISGPPPRLVSRHARSHYRVPQDQAPQGSETK